MSSNGTRWTRHLKVFTLVALATFMLAACDEDTPNHPPFYYDLSEAGPPRVSEAGPTTE